MKYRGRGFCYELYLTTLCLNSYMYFYVHYIFLFEENQSITWLHRIQVFSWNTSERNIHSSIRRSPWRIGRDAQDGPYTAMHIYWGLYTYNDMYCGISKICGDLISVDLMGTPHPWVNILIKLWIKIMNQNLYKRIILLYKHEFTFSWTFKMAL